MAHPNNNKDDSKEEKQKSSSSSSFLKQQIPKASFSPLDDCDRPACDDMVTKMQQMSHALTESGASTLKRVDETMPLSSNASPEVPPNKQELGRASWSLLHSMAAWYPNHPTEADQTHMRQFMDALARFYPCTWCAHDFAANLQKSPPATESRAELCVWLCQQHNLVNEKLGKPIYNCQLDHLDQRWRKAKAPPEQQKDAKDK